MKRAFDAMKRHLRQPRDLPAGDAALCPGKAAGRFNIRTQQWEVVQLRSNPHANCKVEILSLLEGLPEWSLLLFDLGYFSFPWFDYLTQMHFWFVSRLRENTVYQIAHVFSR